MLIDNDTLKFWLSLTSQDILLLATLEQFAKLHHNLRINGMHPPFFFSAELWMWAWSLPIPILSSWFFFFSLCHQRVGRASLQFIAKWDNQRKSMPWFTFSKFQRLTQIQKYWFWKKIFDWKIIISILCQELEFLWLVGYILSYQNSYVSQYSCSWFRHE